MPSGPIDGASDGDAYIFSLPAVGPGGGTGPGEGTGPGVDRTKTHIRIYDTITKGLLSNLWHWCHKTC